MWNRYLRFSCLTQVIRKKIRQNVSHWAGEPPILMVVKFIIIITIIRAIIHNHRVYGKVYKEYTCWKLSARKWCRTRISPGEPRIDIQNQKSIYRKYVSILDLKASIVAPFFVNQREFWEKTFKLDNVLRLSTNQRFAQCFELLR